MVGMYLSTIFHIYLQIFILCVAVASAHATGFYGSSILAPALYNSGIYAPGLLNTVVAPGIGLRGASLLSAALPAAYTTKTVFSAPAVAAPIAYTARSLVAAPAAIAAPVATTYTKSVLAGPAAIAAPVATTYTTKSVVAGPAAIAAPVAYAAPALTTQKTVIGATSLLTGTPLVYSNGLLANRLVSAAAPLAYSSGILSPIGLNKGTPFVAAPGVVKTILK